MAAPTRAELLANMPASRSDVINTGRKSGIDKASIMKAVGATTEPSEVQGPTYAEKIDAALRAVAPPTLRFNEPEYGFAPDPNVVREAPKKRKSYAGTTLGSVVRNTGMKVLQAGVAVPASTAMETMDLITGQGPSAKDWFNQSFVEPISWGVVRDKHPNIYRNMIIPTGGLSAIPYGLDLAGWETGADLSADFMFDLWNATGGLNKFVGVGKGAMKIADDLTEAAIDLSSLGARTTQVWDGAMAAAATEAATVIRKKKSISAGIRVLKQTAEGREVMRQMDLVPGIRFRLPGTGPATRILQLDKLPGIGPMLAKRRAQQVPEFYKQAAKVTDEELAAQILKEAKNRKLGGVATLKNPQAALNDAGDTVESLAYLASRQPVELRAPGKFGLGDEIVQIMDAPLRGFRQAKKLLGGKAVDDFLQKKGLSLFAAPYKFLNVLKESDSPVVGWVGARIHEAGRNADWAARHFNDQIENRVQRALNEAELLGIDKDSLSELAAFDPFIRGQDGSRVARRENLGEEFAELSDDNLEKLYDLSRQAADYASEKNIAARGEGFRTQVDEIIEQEGGYVPRSPTPEGKELLGAAGDDLPLNIPKDKRFEGGNLKDRRVKVGGKVVVTVDKSWVPPEGFDPSRIKEMPSGNRQVTLIDEVADPREVGRSVAKQVNEAANAVDLPNIYETGYNTVWGRYANVVGDDYRMRLIENKMAEFGMLLEDAELDAALLNEIRDQLSKKLGKLSKTKSKISDARKAAKKADDLRRHWWKDNVRPLFPNDEKSLDIAVQWEQAFNDASSAAAELSVVQQRLRELTGELADLNKGVKNSINNPTYKKVVAEAVQLQARARQLEDLSKARNDVVDTLKKMLDIESADGPIGAQPLEVRQYLRGLRGVEMNDQKIAAEAYDDLNEILVEQLDFIENELLPAVYEMSERYGLSTVEAEQLDVLVRGLRNKDGSLKKTQTKKSSSRIQEFHRQIEEFKNIDGELGFEDQLSTANPGFAPKVQAAKAVADAERQTQWIQAQFAALGAADEVGTVARGMDLPTGRFDETPEVVTLKETLELEQAGLVARKVEMLEGLKILQENQANLFDQMQLRFNMADEAMAYGDRADGLYQTKMAQIAQYEAQAESMTFDDIIPLYDKFRQGLDSLSLRAELQRETAETLGFELNKVYDELMDGLQALGAEHSIGHSKETIDTIQKLLKQDNARWGGYHTILGNSEIDVGQVRDVLASFQHINHRESSHQLVEGWDKLQRFIKSQQLATPGFVSRNTQGAFWNAAQAAVNPAMIIRSFKMLRRARTVGGGDYVQGIEILAARGENGYGAMLELVNSGVLRSGQGATSVEAQLQVDKHFAQFIYKRKFGPAKGEAVRRDFNPLKPEFIFNQGIRTANNLVEDAVRLGTGLDVMAKGGSANDGLTLIAKTQFDYNELSEGERYLKQFVYPFWTWTRKNIPLQLSMMYRHPGKLNRLLTIKTNIERMSEQEKTVPAYFLSPFGLRLPFAPGGSQAYFVPDLPFVDLFRADPTSDDFLEQILSDVTPVLKAPIERALGTQFFKGIPISDRYQKMPLNFASIPGLKQALEAMPGNLVRNGKMRANNIYVIQQLIPIYGRLGRIAPVEEKYQGKRQLQSFLSMALGIPIRFNTDEMQSSARYQEKMRKNNLRRDRRDIADADR